jgi:hypothetical protein
MLSALASYFRDKNTARGRICKEFQKIYVRKTLFSTVSGRILIQNVNFGSGSCKMIQIQPDPGPQHCGCCCITADARRSSVHLYSSSLLQKQKPSVLLMSQNNSPYSYYKQSCYIRCAIKRMQKSRNIVPEESRDLTHMLCSQDTLSQMHR